LAIFIGGDNLMSFRPKPKNASVDPSNPQAWFTSDRSGFIGNLRNAVWDRQWAGPSIINRRFLTLPHEYNVPNELLRTIVLPPDPEPIVNARIENYALDEWPGLRVAADRKALRIILRAPGVRGGALIVSGVPGLQTSF
jgi:hypothetical protein